MIELLISVMIVGILLLIALPSYRAYTQESRRSDAMAGLLIAVASQESFYILNNRYSTNITNLGGNSSPDDHYAIAVTATNHTYSITATAKSASSQFFDTDCREFAINQLGVKSSKDSNGNASTTCWN